MWQLPAGVRQSIPKTLHRRGLKFDFWGWFWHPELHCLFYEIKVDQFVLLWVFQVPVQIQISPKFHCLSSSDFKRLFGYFYWQFIIGLFSLLLASIWPQCIRKPWYVLMPSDTWLIVQIGQRCRDSLYLCINVRVHFDRDVEKLLLWLRQCVNSMHGWRLWDWIWGYVTQLAAQRF